MEFVVHACGYGARHPTPNAEMLSGEENAILDFRYANVPRLTFYFDHHKTAFLDEAARLDFERRTAAAPERFVFAPTESSCTKLLASVLQDAHGLELEHHAHLIDWADVIDAARFPTALAATDRSEPVLQLVSVVEQFGDTRFFQKIIPRLATEGLDQIARSPFIQEKYKSLAPEQEYYLEQVRAVSQLRGRTVLVDLTEQRVRTVVKFATYSLFPEATYSVVLARLSSGIKISVGYNPWASRPREHDISSLCARYGGGGHPVVGGIALPKDQIERAREIALALTLELG